MFSPPPSPDIRPFDVPGPQYADPLQTLAQMGQLRAQRSQLDTQALAQQEARLGIQQKQYELGQTQAVNEAYRGAFTPQADGTIGLDTDKLTNALAAGGHGAAIPGILENYTKWQQAGAVLHETNLKNSAAEADAAGNLGATVKAGNYDAGLFHTLMTDAVNKRILTPAHYAPLDQALQQSLQADPTGQQARALVKQFTDQLIAGSPQQQKLESERAPAEAARTKITGEKRTQAVQDLQSIIDPATGVPSTEDYGPWKQQYGTLFSNLPDVPTKDSMQSLVRAQVPVGEQPAFDIKSVQANLSKNLTPAAIDAQVDEVLNPDRYTDPSVKAQVRNENAIAKSRAKSNIPNGYEKVSEQIKDSVDRVGRLTAAIAQGHATAGTKIEVAAATAQAKADAGGLTPDDYARAGEEYARTGVMPPMGRDSVTRARIAHAKNEWARDNGLSPADVVTMQAAYQGDKESLKNFQKQRDQVVSFEQTAQKNLDLFLDAASKIPDTGVPWLNKPLRELNAGLVGSTNMAAVNAARQVANNEIAKVTSGGGMSGVLSDSARHEVAEYNPANATFAQTKAVARILREDMANRHQSMDATLSDIKSRIGGGGQAAGGGQASQHVIKIGNQHYRYNGTGPTNDLKNYTEIQP